MKSIFRCVSHFPDECINDLDVKTFVIHTDVDTTKSFSAIAWKLQRVLNSFVKEYCKSNNIQSNVKAGFLGAFDYNGTRFGVQDRIDKNTLHIHALLFLPFDVPNIDDFCSSFTEFVTRNMCFNVNTSSNKKVSSGKGILFSNSVFNVLKNMEIKLYKDERPLWCVADYNAKLGRYSQNVGVDYLMEFPYAGVVERNKKNKQIDRNVEILSRVDCMYSDCMAKPEKFFYYDVNKEVFLSDEEDTDRKRYSKTLGFAHYVDTNGNACTFQQSIDDWLKFNEVKKLPPSRAFR